MQKSVYCSKLVLLQSFYCSEWIITWTEVVCLIIDTLLPLSSCLILNYFIISLRYSFIHSSLNYSSYFFLSIKLLFLMSSEICKEYREYLYLSYALRGKCPLFERIHCVKSARVRSYSGPHFPAFGLNTERSLYSVCILCNSVSLRIQSKCGKIREKCGPE